MKIHAKSDKIGNVLSSLMCRRKLNIDLVPTHIFFFITWIKIYSLYYHTVYFYGMPLSATCKEGWRKV